MKICNNCGKKVNKKFEFCPNCGSNNIAIIEKKLIKLSKKKILMGLTIFLLISILAVGGYNIYKNMPQSNKRNDKVKQVYIITDYINLRSSNNIESPKKAQVYKGEIYTVLDESNGWVKIKTNKNITGWIISKSNNEIYIKYLEINGQVPEEGKILENSIQKESTNEKNIEENLKENTNTDNLEESVKENNIGENLKENTNTDNLEESVKENNIGENIEKTPKKNIVDESKKNNILSFNDVFFENCLKNALGKSGTEKITEYDMLQLKELILSDGVVDIEGIEYAKNLNSITIDSNNIKNLNKLSSIPNIQKVNFGFWKKIDISFLKSLPNVTYIYYNNPTLIGGSFSDLCSSSKLTKLFFYNPINEGDISFLSNCKSINDLELWHAFTTNSDISLLLNLNKLNKLTILTYDEYSEKQQNVIKELIKKGVSYKKM